MQDSADEKSDKSTKKESSESAFNEVTSFANVFLNAKVFLSIC